MCSGRELSVDEKTIVIVNLVQKNKSKSETSRVLNRSRRVIANFPKDSEKYSTKKSSGRPGAVSACEELAILRRASQSFLTCHQVAAEAGTETNDETNL